MGLGTNGTEEEPMQSGTGNGVAGKRVVLTGGTNGIGLAAAAALVPAAPTWLWWHATRPAGRPQPLVPAPAPQPLVPRSMCW